MINKIDQILNFLDKTFPDAKCALEYTKDYELLIAVMLSAQTTDAAVNKATKVLFSRLPNLYSIKNADISEIEDCIKFLGLYKNKAKNVQGIATRLLEDCGGKVPNNPEYLVTLPGVGNKTKNCVLAELYNEPLLAVDTHVQRISKRLKLVKANDDVSTIERKLVKLIPSDRLVKTGHEIIWFGRTICKAQHPLCEKCELHDLCNEYKHHAK